MINNKGKKIMVYCTNFISAKNGNELEKKISWSYDTLNSKLFCLSTLVTFTNQVEPVFGILSLNPCDSQTKLNLYLDKMISLAYNTFLFSGNRLGQSYTEVEFNSVTNLTNQCVVQKIF